ncbi:DNA-binding response regulator [Enemella evansiae]|uniref:DNA-binding response regulator n=1 Tax=Enemella evansiae TaxID=2016499 RepID=A0A255GEU6_9ACTN|nr:response regulator transcription factor [Enemella evansiae]OYO05003.1 DNA-binding response regulator [Enemella evansiae]OYO14369.1 DNA-binding response regulator [Enemella evansiae]
MSTLRLLLVDDHPVVRRGLRAVCTDPGARRGVPELEEVLVVGEAGDGQQALDLLFGTVPLPVDVVLMDLQMPVLDGVTTIGRITAHEPHPVVLVLTTYDSDADLAAALDAGASGYLLKDAAANDIVAAAWAAARGERALAPELERRLAARATAPDLTLTARELEILAAIATGRSNREVARGLFISEATVKTHLVHIFDKLGVDNRTQAVRVARERRILR